MDFIICGYSEKLKFCNITNVSENNLEIAKISSFKFQLNATFDKKKSLYNTNRFFYEKSCLLTKLKKKPLLHQ